MYRIVKANARKLQNWSHTWPTELYFRLGNTTHALKLTPPTALLSHTNSIQDSIRKFKSNTTNTRNYLILTILIFMVEIDHLVIGNNQSITSLYHSSQSTLN